MFKLKPIEGTELTAYTLQLLDKHDITTEQDFLQTDVSKLCKIINLSETILLDLKQKLRQKHGPEKWLLSSYYDEKWRTSWCSYGTGIEALDHMLGTEAFATGCVYEICGVPGVGKTQLCHTIALNFTSRHQGEVLYLDTKSDFVGKRIRQMLRSRNVDKGQCAHVMQSIKVERTYSAEGVVNVLQRLSEHLDTATTQPLPGAAIKVVIIDALPSVWLHFCGDDRKQGKYMLTILSNLVHKLAQQHFIAFLLVNLLVTKEDQMVENGFQNVIEAGPSCPLASNEPTLSLSLGRYWSSVPKVRLSLEMPVGLHDINTTAREIKVLKSCYSRTGDHCSINITDAGIV